MGHLSAPDTLDPTVCTRGIRVSAAIQKAERTARSSSVAMQRDPAAVWLVVLRLARGGATCRRSLPRQLPSFRRSVSTLIRFDVCVRLPTTQEPTRPVKFMDRPKNSQSDCRVTTCRMIGNLNTIQNSAGGHPSTSLQNRRESQYMY